MIVPSSREVTTPIVPSVVSYYELPGEKSLDLRAICAFSALGFFLDDDTYFTNYKTFRPATTYNFDEAGVLISRQRYFDWHYSPASQSFEMSLDQFCSVFERVTRDSVSGQRIILPISGGLDSRALAVAVRDRKDDVHAYSYQFSGGTLENQYGGAVAEALGYNHQSFEIQQGYLWNVIDELAVLNGCYAEFTNPRQMAIWQQLSNNGDIFLLGHGGDLFFDGMGVDDRMTEDEQVHYLFKKMIKPEGFTLGSRLWEAWSQAGDFKEYLLGRIQSQVHQINIENANARLRAYKTENYVARWTAVNLELFQEQHPISVPFFHDDICRMICEIPEEHLSGRKLEIEYIKRVSPKAANVPWQKYYPCNLYDYGLFDSFTTRVHRAMIKGVRIAKGLVGFPGDRRNWELQFQGRSNREHLKSSLMTAKGLVPMGIKEKVWQEFIRQPDRNVHPVTMLLTLSLFEKHFLGRQFY